MLSTHPHDPNWRQVGIGIWEATIDGAPLGSIEASRAYGFIVKGSGGNWLANFSVLENAMWFLPIAQRVTVAH